VIAAPRFAPPGTIRCPGLCVTGLGERSRLRSSQGQDAPKTRIAGATPLPPRDSKIKSVQIKNRQKAGSGGGTGDQRAPARRRSGRAKSTGARSIPAFRSRRTRSRIVVGLRTGNRHVDVVCRGGEIPRLGVTPGVGASARGTGARPPRFTVTTGGGHPTNQPASSAIREGDRCR